MFKRRTLFVVGAGASAEVDFPVGGQLARIISDKLDVRINHGEATSTSDPEFFEQINRAFRSDINEYIRAARLIRDGVRLSNSIDDFLDIHSADLRVQRIGKAAIVRAILEAEKSSKLYVDQSNANTKMDYSRIDETWYMKLMRLLGRANSLANVDFIFDNIAFIVFNYDRCIEHFLINALQQLYGINRDIAAKTVGRLTIIHPYGIAGLLDSGVPFGGDQLNFTNCVALAERIKTYTEQVAEGEVISQIHDEVRKAEQIVFLGFAYHDQNLALLKPSTRLELKRFVGTGYGMSSSDQAVVMNQLAGFLQHSLSHDGQIEYFKVMNTLKCSELFDYFAKSIAA